MGGKSSGRQIVGWRFAGPSGSRTKGQPPATGDCRHGRFLGDGACGDALEALADSLLGIRDCASRIPTRFGTIEFLLDVACVRRAPVHRSWHG